MTSKRPENLGPLEIPAELPEDTSADEFIALMRSQGTGDTKVDLVVTHALTQLIGETPLPALLFVNSDLKVIRVDVDRITDPRMLAMMRAVMSLTSQIQGFGAANIR